MRAGSIARSALDGQHLDAVLVRELAAAHGIFELHAKYSGRANAALRRKRAAKHGPAGLERIAAKQVFGRAHRRYCTFLVELAVGPRAQHETLPVLFHFVVAPRLFADRLR